MTTKTDLARKLELDTAQSRVQDLDKETLQGWYHVRTMDQETYNREVVETFHKGLEEMKSDNLQRLNYMLVNALAPQVGKAAKRDALNNFIWCTLASSLGFRGSKTLLFLLAKRVPLTELVDRYNLRKNTNGWIDAARALYCVANLYDSGYLLNKLSDLDRLHFQDRVIPPTMRWEESAAVPKRIIFFLGYWIRQYGLDPLGWIAAGCPPVSAGQSGLHSDFHRLNNVMRWDGQLEALQQVLKERGLA